LLDFGFLRSGEQESFRGFVPRHHGILVYVHDLSKENTHKKAIVQQQKFPMIVTVLGAAFFTVIALCGCYEWCCERGMYKEPHSTPGYDPFFLYEEGMSGDDYDEAVEADATNNDPDDEVVEFDADQEDKRANEDHEKDIDDYHIV